MISVAGTDSTMVSVMATDVSAVELHVHAVTATVTVSGLASSCHTGEH
jgi:hypothetical protein